MRIVLDIDRSPHKCPVRFSRAVDLPGAASSGLFQEAPEFFVLSRMGHHPHMPRYEAAGIAPAAIFNFTTVEVFQIMPKTPSRDGYGLPVLLRLSARWGNPFVTIREIPA